MITNPPPKGKWTVRVFKNGNVEYHAEIYDIGKTTGSTGGNPCHCPVCRKYIPVLPFFSIESMNTFGTDGYKWHDLTVGEKRTRTHNCGAVLVVTNL